MSSEEADRRIAEVRSTGSTRLDLSNLPRGEEVPDSLSDLVSLEQLDLSENKDRLIQVPESIRHLSNLKTLNLNRNYLPQLPEWLGELTLLNELELAHNKLEHLPDSIGQLSQLRRLDFRANEIPVVPEWLRQLPNLTSLGISMKDELPTFLRDLSSLEELDLSKNRYGLTRVPESIRNLNNLKILNLSFCKLNHLPEWLGELTQLTELNVGFNNLEHLPDSIGQLRQLRRLDFAANEIAVVPEWLGQLPNLEFLGISMNDELPVSLIKTVNREGIPGLHSWLNSSHEESEADHITLGERVLELIDLHEGTCDIPTGPLDKVISSIEFPRGLYAEADLQSISLSAAHNFVMTNAELRSDEPDEWEEALWGLIAEGGIGVRFEQQTHLSPNDFTDLIPDAATNMQELIRGPVTEPMEFLQFASGVSPDTLMVYLQDTDPSDPLVYIDDHETMWQATHTKTLSALLESFITIEQAEEIIDTMAERWVE